jgi:hypothetical protein
VLDPRTFIVFSRRSPCARSWRGSRTSCDGRRSRKSRGPSPPGGEAAVAVAAGCRDGNPFCPESCVGVAQKAIDRPRSCTKVAPKLHIRCIGRLLTCLPMIHSEHRPIDSARARLYGGARGEAIFWEMPFTRRGPSRHSRGACLSFPGDAGMGVEPVRVATIRRLHPAKTSAPHRLGASSSRNLVRHYAPDPISPRFGPSFGTTRQSSGREGRRPRTRRFGPASAGHVELSNVA